MTVPPLKTTPNDRSTRWLERLLFVAFLLACGVALSQNQADPDFWGHVQYGRDALRDGLPATTSYSYTANGYPWINHEIVSEYLMALGVEFPGPAGMLVFKCLLGFLVVSLIYRAASKEGVAQVPIFATTLLVVCSLMHSWSLRPQLLTYTLFAVMIALLGWCFAGWRTPWTSLVHFRRSEKPEQDALLERAGRLNWLWLFVPVFTRWTNTHGGFLAGFCIFAAYLGGRSFELLVSCGRRAVPAVLLMTGIVIAGALATLLNPYGVELHRWLLHSLGTARPEILEWRPPELLSVVWPAWWVMVAVTLAAVAATRRPRDLTQLIILGLTLWQACEHRRHIAFFALLFGFWMPVHVESLIQRCRRRPARDADPERISTRMRRALIVGMSVATLLMSFVLFKQLRDIPVRRDSYPVTAFQFITDHHLEGKLITRFKWAQYAIAAFGTSSPERPNLLVAFDGRFRTCYPQEIVDLYFDFALGNEIPEMRRRSPNSPPADGSRILGHEDPNLVLIDREMTHAVKVMSENKDAWTLLYQDSLSQLWGRAEIYDDPDHPDYLPIRQRVIGDQPQKGFVAWPAFPRPGNSKSQLADVTHP